MSWVKGACSRIALCVCLAAATAAAAAGAAHAQGSAVTAAWGSVQAQPLDRDNMSAGRRGGMEGRVFLRVERAPLRKEHGTLDVQLSAAGPVTLRGDPVQPEKGRFPDSLEVVFHIPQRQCGIVRADVFLAGPDGEPGQGVRTELFVLADVDRLYTSAGGMVESQLLWLRAVREAGEIDAKTYDESVEALLSSPSTVPAVGSDPGGAGEEEEACGRSWWESVLSTTRGRTPR